MPSTTTRNRQRAAEELSMDESRLKDALRWCLLYMTDCNGDLRSAEGRRLTPPPQIDAAFNSAYDANFKKPQSDARAEP